MGLNFIGNGPNLKLINPIELKLINSNSNLKKNSSNSKINNQLIINFLMIKPWKS